MVYSYDRTARLPTDESKQFQRDEANRLKHIKGARSAFSALLKELQPLASAVKAEFPQRDQLSIQRRGKSLVKQLKVDPGVTAYLDKWIGLDTAHPQAYSWRGGVLYALRDVLVFGKTLKEGLEDVEKQTFKGFEAITMAEAQAPLKRVVPTELLAFMPKNIVIEVDANGTIERVTDRFENEHFTLGKKVERMRDLVGQYNAIAKKVRKDLGSRDEITRLAALVTAIIMETGIRPGKEGNGVIKTVNGEEIEIETFGATTLGPNHVRFIRDNFAELEFLGKKGGRNVAQLVDQDIIKVLNDYVQRALQSGSKYVFVTKAGVEFSYADLQRYFKENFDGFAPTDFRKLRATDAMLTALRNEQVGLYERIRGFAKLAKGDLKQRVVQEIVQAFNAAAALAQTALSHDKVNTTVQSYLNPEIVLRFLATGKVDDTLEAAILTGTTKLMFDPEVFLRAATVPKTAGTAPRALGVLLEALKDELEEAGVYQI